MKNLKQLIGAGIMGVSLTGSFIAGNLVIDRCGNKEKENLVSEQITESDLFPDKENKLECSCLPEIGLPQKSKLIGCYDIDKDGDLDCIYKQDSTQKIFLYDAHDKTGFSFAGEYIRHGEEK